MFAKSINEIALEDVGCMSSQTKVEMASQKRIAVIGAGSSGLTAIKACKEENLDVVCFERNGHPGGLWKYHDDDINGVASVMKTTIINTNKQLGSFSDFPPPKHYPNFMHHSMMFKYFMKYAKKFDLLKHIRYYKEVIRVIQADDFQKTGRWIVTTKDSTTQTVQDEEFDGVMVAIGHHVFPKIPNFPGQENFKGQIFHTHSLKSCESFRGMKVAVVGIGNSGVDAAVDAAYVADQAYLSTRRGSWVFGRVGKGGFPYDFAFANRLKIFLSKFRSFEAICSDMERKLNSKFDHELYNLKPKHRILSAHPTINDNLPNCILSGRIVVKGDIKRFTEDGVVFEGDNETTKLDVVIFATGYYIKFPFLEENLVSTKDNEIHLYKYSIPPSLQPPTLSIIALIQPLGPIFPVAEMQSRWFIQLFTGKIKLPPTDVMERDIISKREENAKRYVASTRHTIEVDFIPFLDELAEEIGVKPQLTKLAFTDPKLFWACLVEPCLPYQYRLEGPHRWEGAREAILTYKENFMEPLNTRKMHKKQEYAVMQQQQFISLFIFVIFTAVLFAWFFRTG